MIELGLCTKTTGAIVAIAALVWVADPLLATAQTRGAVPDRPNNRLPELCTSARAILQAALIDRAGKRDVLSFDPPDYLVQPSAVSGIQRMTPFGPRSDYWRIGWEGRPPSPEVVQRWYKLPYGSMSRCFLSKNTERPLFEIFGSSIRGFTPVDGETLSTVRVSYPAFDRSKTHAILLYSRFFIHGLGGRLELVSLTRTKSGWKKTGFRGLWQS